MPLLAALGCPWAALGELLVPSWLLLGAPGRSGCNHGTLLVALGALLAALGSLVAVLVALVGRPQPLYFPYIIFARRENRSKSLSRRNFDLQGRILEPMGG